MFCSARGVREAWGLALRAFSVLHASVLGLSVLHALVLGSEL